VATRSQNQALGCRTPTQVGYGVANGPLFLDIGSHLCAESVILQLKVADGFRVIRSYRRHEPKTYG
jgi:hypothetical protein